VDFLREDGEVGAHPVEIEGWGDSAGFALGGQKMRHL
jgi:hypothetical protein